MLSLGEIETAARLCPDVRDVLAMPGQDPAAVVLFVCGPSELDAFERALAPLLPANLLVETVLADLPDLDRVRRAFTAVRAALADTLRGTGELAGEHAEIKLARQAFPGLRWTDVTGEQASPDPVDPIFVGTDPFQSAMLIVRGVCGDPEACEFQDWRVVLLEVDGTRQETGPAPNLDGVLELARNTFQALEPGWAAPRAGTCRNCGCTDVHGCAPACWWVDDSQTLCSTCAPKAPQFGARVAPPAGARDRVLGVPGVEVAHVGASQVLGDPTAFVLHVHVLPTAHVAASEDAADELVEAVQAAVGDLTPFVRVIRWERDPNGFYPCHLCLAPRQFDELDTLDDDLVCGPNVFCMPF